MESTREDWIGVAKPQCDRHALETKQEKQDLYGTNVSKTTPEKPPEKPEEESTLHKAAHKVEEKFREVEEKVEEKLHHKKENPTKKSETF
jgi:hypothetical protein